MSKMMTFEDYLIGEGFFDSLGQGFKKNYNQSKSSDDGGQYAQYANKAMEAINKSRQIAGKFAQKLGIDPILATSLVASGIVGGPAAMPMAALLYFVRKPINKAASNGFDKVADKMGWSGQQDEPAQQIGQAHRRPFAGGRPSSLHPQMSRSKWMGGKPQWMDDALSQRLRNERKPPANMRPKNNALDVQNSWNLSFANYADGRDLNEGFGDKVGGAIGGLAGKVAGKGSSMIKSSMSSIAKFASENKLAIGKTAFMVALGAAIGMGVGMTPNGVQSAFSSVADTGVIPQPELKSLQADLGIDSSSGPDTGNGHTDPGVQGVTPDGRDLDQPVRANGDGNRFWGSQIGDDPIAGGESPEVDSTGALPKGRLYPNYDTADPNDYLNNNGNPGYSDSQMSDTNAVSDADFDSQDQARRQAAIDNGNEDPGARSREDYAKQDRHSQMRNRHDARNQRLFNRKK